MTITQSMGVVSGSTVRAKNVFKDIGAGFKNMVGGELKAYTELLQESRNEALYRMLVDAQSRGANAVSMCGLPLHLCQAERLSCWPTVQQLPFNEASIWNLEL